MLKEPIRFEGIPTSDEWSAFAASAITTNNGIEVISVSPKKWPRFPSEPSVVLVSDRAGDGPNAFKRLDEDTEKPAVTIIATKCNFADLIPTLIATVRRNEWSVVVFTNEKRIHEWAVWAGSRLIHVAIPDPVKWFGDAL